MIEDILDFVTESNMIEGIFRPPNTNELEATTAFICLTRLTIGDVAALVKVYQPNAVLRDKEGLNVRVGNHVAPLGGPHLLSQLNHLLETVNLGYDDPWRVHLAYEHLHPFTDGNGRSGRAIWLWQMLREKRPVYTSFLQTFYYQTLEHND